MARLQSASALVRVVFALTLAFLLSVRLLSPAGFMPSFEGGAVSIVSCPDFGSPPIHHGHTKSTQTHQSCPYAAASSLDVMGFAGAILAAVLLIGAAFLLGRTYRLIERSRRYRLPPPRGPPLPA